LNSHTRFFEDIGSRQGPHPSGSSLREGPRLIPRCEISGCPKVFAAPAPPSGHTQRL
jgi:hypothetical protein